MHVVINFDKITPSTIHKIFLQRYFYHIEYKLRYIVAPQLCTMRVTHLLDSRLIFSGFYQILILYNTLQDNYAENWLYQ